QASSDQQNERESHLRDDKNIAHTERSGSAYDALPTFFQRLAQIEPRSFNRRNQSEHNAGNHRQANCETKHGPIDGGPANVNQFGRAEREQCTRAPNSEQQTEPSAEESQYHALGKQLAHNPPAAGSESRAQCDLALTR